MQANASASPAPRPDGDGVSPVAGTLLPIQRAEELLGTLPGVRGAPRKRGDRLALNVEELHIALPAILAAAQPFGLKGLSHHRATLEDVFVSLTGRQLRE